MIDFWLAVISNNVEFGHIYLLTISTNSQYIGDQFSLSVILPNKSYIFPLRFMCSWLRNLLLYLLQRVFFYKPHTKVFNVNFIHVGNKCRKSNSFCNLQNNVNILPYWYNEYVAGTLDLKNLCIFPCFVDFVPT